MSLEHLVVPESKEVVKKINTSGTMSKGHKRQMKRATGVQKGGNFNKMK